MDRLTEGREGEAGPWGMPTLCLGSWRVGERTQGETGARGAFAPAGLGLEGLWDVPGLLDVSAASTRSQA